MYSQNDEQAHILKWVEYNEAKVVASGCEPSRRLLDIGAWDPKTFSNSRALIEAGWGGVLIEPSPIPFAALINAYVDREDITLLNGAVSCMDDFMWMDTTPDALSTFDAGEREKWESRGTKFQRRLVPTWTIETLLTAFGGFAFVNIDTEGNAVDIAREYLATGQEPYCICVEHNRRIEELMKYAQPRGYAAVHITDENVILARPK